MQDASPTSFLTTTNVSLAMAASNDNSVPAGFKEIPGYDGRYFINEHGDVWSVYKRGLMCPQTDATHLYPWVLVMENGRAQPRTVYYLMRLTWMPPAPGEVGIGRDKWCVNHKDGNKLNSHIDNLEWLTCSDNVKHAWDNGLNRVAVGESSKNAKFTSDEVRQIRLRLLLGEKTKNVANEYQCNIALIKKMQWYVSWKHQDHDLVEPMIKICNSKWLRVMQTKLQNGERMEECCNRVSRGRNKWNEESLALYSKKLELADSV